MISSNESLFILGLSIVLLLLGAFLSFIAKNSKQGNESTASKIEKILPGVQCAQCGFPGCSAYAEAVASGAALCNKCIPGGPDTVKEIAALLGIAPPSEEDEDLVFLPRLVAVIDENQCTGCSKCLKHCPVDAIEGKIKTVHHINSEECIGCADCSKICPEQCISMQRLKPTSANFNWDIKAVTVKGDKQ